MVSLVLVSHSRALAQAAAELARKVSPKSDIPIFAAGGTGTDRSELGTDVIDILETIQKAYSESGVLILMDLGSAVISSRAAVEMLDEKEAAKVVLCSAPIVEGAVGAAVQIAAGATFDEVKEEALNGLVGKQAEIGDTEF
ncbi:MAG: PTS-dependent dihydroxyacetone kinase phosphotransferase subunit DhaM [Elusimicrobiota bacterium]|jgi:phosphocarrier protein FPr|nr:PTS-dependent dihydroxyacetone kinase phosphotransferase subunit DhaM [Elusimicrobiota bacterium]